MPNPLHPAPGWHSRGYLPHLDVPGLLQSISFRLGDSLPRYTIEQIYSTTRPDDPERLRRVERMLDAGRGACWLGRPEIAGLVEALPVVTPRRKAQAAWTAIQCPGCAMAWRGAIRAGLCVRAPLLTAVNSRRGVRRRVVLRIRRL